MPKIPRLALTLALFVLPLGGAGLAYGASLTIDALADLQLVPTAMPGLLGAVDEVGRNGWKCLPERAARAKNWKEAELPDETPD